jgi:hypothetical protein
LESLMMFGFYNSAIQLQDVINPLVQALDDHRFDSWPGKSLGLRKKSTTEVVDLDKQPISQSDSINDFDRNDPKAVLNKLNELGLTDNETKPYYRRWLSEIWDKIEDSYIYELLSRYFIKDDIEDTMHSKLFSNEPDTEKMWERVVLEKLESLHTLCIMLTVVVTVCVLALIRVFEVVQDSLSYSIFDIIVSAVFIAELIIRMYCYVRVNKTIVSFFRNFFNVNDFLIVLFDIVIISLGASTGFEKIGA